MFFLDVLEDLDVLEVLDFSEGMIVLVGENLIR